jgi:RNA polymerase sigma-70 factor (ECF subfamily)
MANHQPSPRHAPNRTFATTEWSVVLAARVVGGDAQKDANEALGQLCETYWYPLYAYIRRLVGNADEAQDLTQEFFFHLLEKRAIAKADRSRGRFRTFLLAALKNFLANEWDKARARKRGGGRRAWSLDVDAGESRYKAEPTDDLTPEIIYERRWVHALLDQVVRGLHEELTAADKAEHFEQLKGALTGEMAAEEYERAAQALGITPAAAKQSAYRLRKRYRQLFRQEVARTVADDSEVEDEIGRLLATLGG